MQLWWGSVSTRGWRLAVVWPRDLVFSPAERIRRYPNGSISRNGVRDAVQLIVTAISGLASRGPVGGILWRGLPSRDYGLSSTLGRKYLGRSEPSKQQYEREMIAAVRKAGIDGSQHLSDVEILARLRHHSAATRLIDVSSDPYISLCFACSADPDSDALLVAMDARQFDGIAQPWDCEYTSLLSSPRGKAHLAIGPLDARIAAQRGSFVLATQESFSSYSEIPVWIPDGWSGKKLERVCDGSPWSGSRGRPVQNFPTVVGVVIPYQSKPSVIEMLLRGHGIGRHSVYPDFSGLGDEYSIAPRL